ncbi:MAG: LysR family transcriptional regulator [Deltaproteobacteria bacterium]|nr:LysR family transcriptional regulator [Deltaproteobacteria bacterium]
MDLEALRIFIKVAELASFTRAAEHLGIPKARVSLQVKALEAELDIHLLQRTTRSVRPTPDGEQLLVRARRLVSDSEELEAMFQSSKALHGVVRLDTPVNLARDVLVPRLPEFLARHPLIELQLSTTDRRVDILREGFDVVLRVGALADSGLMSKRLGEMAMTNVASVAYLRSRGAPRTPEELDQHLLVNYAGTFGAEPPEFEWVQGGQTFTRQMRASITVNNVDAYHAACLAGLGIIQCPRRGVARDLAAGTLVEVLPQFVCAPLPVSLIHAHGRTVPKRVRAVMAWVTELVQPGLS